MNGAASYDKSSDISWGNASNIEYSDFEFEYRITTNDSDTTNEEEYYDQPRKLPREEAPKSGLWTRDGWIKVTAARFAN